MHASIVYMYGKCLLHMFLYATFCTDQWTHRLWLQRFERKPISLFEKSEPWRSY